MGDPVVAPSRVIALPTDARQRQRLLEISRSRTEPTGRVERARIILAYLDDPSAYAVARAIGVTQQTVTRCLERAAELGVIEALDDRPRAGRDPVMTAEAKTWLVALACRKAKELGYPHELWTTRLLAAHARQHGQTAGHPSLAKLAQGTVCKILAEHEVKFIGDKIAVGTRRGEIWIIDDAYNPDPSKAKFSRFANGLHEVLGLAYKDGWLPDL